MAKGPLSGRKIAVTSLADTAQRLAAALRGLGADVEIVPLIRTEPPASYARLDAALRGMRAYDAAAFTSIRAVEAFFSRACAVGRPAPARPRQVYAVGPATAQALRRRGWKARSPRTHDAAALAESMGEVRNLRILLPRGGAGRDALPQLLRARGARVDAVTVYKTLANRLSRQQLRRLAGCELLTFTSGSAVDSFCAQPLRTRIRGRLRTGPRLSRRRRRALTASLGPVTTAAMLRHGIRPDVEAPRAEAGALCRAIAGYFLEAGRL